MDGLRFFDVMKHLHQFLCGQKAELLRNRTLKCAKIAADKNSHQWSCCIFRTLPRRCRELLCNQFHRCWRTGKRRLTWSWCIVSALTLHRFTAAHFNAHTVCQSVLCKPQHNFIFRLPESRRSRCLAYFLAQVRTCNKYFAYKFRESIFGILFYSSTLVGIIPEFSKIGRNTADWIQILK